MCTHKYSGKGTNDYCGESSFITCISSDYNLVFSTKEERDKVAMPATASPLSPGFSSLSMSHLVSF